MSAKAEQITIAARALSREDKQAVADEIRIDLQPPRVRQLNGGVTRQPFYQSNRVTGSVIQILPYETQHYNSLQATLSHRFTNGFRWSTNYTRSKQMGTCCDENDDATGGPQIQVPQRTNLNRAILPSDRPNNFNTSVVYQLPFGKGKQFLADAGMVSKIVGGWQLNSIFIHYSGSPFSASGGTALNTPGFNQRTQQVNTSAFQAVTAAGVIGDSGYDTLRGPGATKLDMSVFRSFKVMEPCMEALTSTLAST